ncbi:unnamed protein product [Cylicostephanus goldi]|uniref:Uncharacterized protein n=1 Tax=Cylicostephanus goldi TaxID=71465 RepID=A0A3P6SUV6_CYLGO|nr:unnamed protein product [Cylicostephanus goldi]
MAEEAKETKESKDNLKTAHGPISAMHPPQSSTPKHEPRIARFTASILVLWTLGVSQMISQRLASGATLPIAQLLFVFLCAYTHEWNYVHGEGLTRARRAYFDIVNVLETYQTRARTMGHLFDPGPPTPMVSFSKEKVEGEDRPGATHEASTEKTDFTLARDAHYANMYQIAMKFNKELEMMQKNLTSTFFQAGIAEKKDSKESSGSGTDAGAPKGSKKEKKKSKNGSKKSNRSKGSRKKGSKSGKKSSKKGSKRESKKDSKNGGKNNDPISSDRNVMKM